MDALAFDEKGNLINIEVQRAVSLNLNKRARYYGSMIDANSLKKGADFKDLPETYVIFITEKDSEGLGLPAYRAERMFLHNHSLTGDGLHTVYVNGEYRGDDPIGNLMNDFFCKGADEMKNDVLADRMRFFKETEEGLSELSEVDARSVERGRVEGRVEGKAEGKAEARLEIAKNLLQLGQLSLEAIARVSGIPVDELKQLKKSLAPA